MSLSRKFRYMIDFDWFNKQCNWPEVKYQELGRLFINLLPQVFIPYYADLTKRATLESSVSEFSLIGF